MQETTSKRCHPIMNRGNFEVIRKYMKKYKGIRDPLHFLGVDCFSYGFNKGLYIQDLNAILIDFITILAVFV